MCFGREVRSLRLGAIEAGGQGASPPPFIRGSWADGPLDGEP